MPFNVGFGLRQVPTLQTIVSITGTKAQPALDVAVILTDTTLYISVVLCTKIYRERQNDFNVYA